MKFTIRPSGFTSQADCPKGPTLSIVGTRNPTRYGLSFARQLAQQLAEIGFCVVSGMARGIDTAAHEGALEAQGKTLAFLGSGIDVVYPPENLGLYNRIIKQGAVASEYPFGRKPDRHTFPKRNRLVAGVSVGIIVIESASFRRKPHHRSTCRRSRPYRLRSSRACRSSPVRPDVTA